MPRSSSLGRPILRAMSVRLAALLLVVQVAGQGTCDAEGFCKGGPGEPHGGKLVEPWPLKMKLKM